MPEAERKSAIVVRCPRGQRPSRLAHISPAFTLLELLVTMAILSIFFVMLLAMTNNTSKLWRTTRSDLQIYENARAACDILSRRVSEATIKPYMDYYDSAWKRRDPTDSTFVPQYYGRATDLDFRAGQVANAPFSMGGSSQGHAIAFFAPLGYTSNSSMYNDLPGLLNACAYFVEYDDGKEVMPLFLQSQSIPKRYRFRLKEIVQPSQDFKTQATLTDTNIANDNDWIASLLGSTASKHPLAENIIALIIRPEIASKDLNSTTLTQPWSLTTDYTYNPRDPSQNSAVHQGIQWSQMPPLLRMILVAVDEKDAARVCIANTIPPELKVSGFTDPNSLDADLAALETQLSSNRIGYKIFSTVFPVRSAKWSAN